MTISAVSGNGEINNIRSDNIILYKIAMKYFCQNVKTLENGITGALNFDLLKCKKMVSNQNFDMHLI